MKPTERFKKRYVSFSLTANGAAPNPTEARSIIHEHFLSMFGEFGIASLAFKLVKYEGKTGRGVLRCERSRVEETIFCMGCLAKWHSLPARIEPLSTSGTIKRV